MYMKNCRNKRKDGDRNIKYKQKHNLAIKPSSKCFVVTGRMTEVDGFVISQDQRTPV